MERFCAKAARVPVRTKNAVRIKIANLLVFLITNPPN